MSNELSKQVSQNYEVVQTPDGKFMRKPIYQPFTSVTPETREQKIAMMNLLESDEVALPMNFHVGTKIKVADVILNPYDSINEETGEITNGILTYLITHDGTAYVTSSKSVYFTIQRIFTVFGEPHYNEDEAIIVEIVKKKGNQFQYIDLKVVG